MLTKLLKNSDWQLWKNFRLEALKNSPESFGSSYEEEIDFSGNDFKDILNKNQIFVAFANSEIIGCIGFNKTNLMKMSHRGNIWGMYIKAEFRGKGVSDILMDALIAHARNHVTQLYLTCVTTNYAAMKLYQRHDFKIYATEPRALKVGNNFYDEHLMVLMLD